MAISRRTERKDLPERLAGAGKEIHEPPGFGPEGAYSIRSGE
jgi:hypothetical protein